MPPLRLPRVGQCTREFSTARSLSKAPNRAKNKEKTQAARTKAKKKHPEYQTYDLNDAVKFSLCDAMRYVRAFEVGRNPTSPKYECAIKLRALRDAPIIRGQIKLPHSVKTDIKVCVICPPDSKQAQQAREAGAFMVGEDEVFDVVKSGKIPFDRCIATPASVPNIAKAGIARILGPRGLMPSNKLGTVTENVANSVKLMLGGNIYKENNGIVRMAVGRLNYSPEQLRDNLRAFLDKLKLDAGSLSETSPKSVLEVVLSSTHSPGFTLDGNFRSDDSPSTELLSG